MRKRGLRERKQEGEAGREKEGESGKVTSK